LSMHKQEKNQTGKSRGLWNSVLEKKKGTQLTPDHWRDRKREGCPQLSVNSLVKFQPSKEKSTVDNVEKKPSYNPEAISPMKIGLQTQFSNIYQCNATAFIYTDSAAGVTHNTSKTTPSTAVCFSRVMRRGSYPSLGKGFQYIHNTEWV
ncbi:hypothetical protein BaRGS_00016503, partial [Batillaria attramentaria]